MERLEGKTATSSLLGRFRSKLLRLYRADRALEDSLLGRKTAGHGSALADSYQDSRRETEEAMIQAEYTRALGLMERQKQHFR